MRKQPRPRRPPEALSRLPHPYAVALQLHESGASDVVIARHLDVEPEAVGPLLRIARTKLEHLLEEPTEP